MNSTGIFFELPLILNLKALLSKKSVELIEMEGFIEANIDNYKVQINEYWDDYSKCQKKITLQDIETLEQIMNPKIKELNAGILSRKRIGKPHKVLKRIKIGNQLDYKKSLFVKQKNYEWYMKKWSKRMKDIMEVNKIIEK